MIMNNADATLVCDGRHSFLDWIGLELCVCVCVGGPVVGGVVLIK